MFSMWLHSLSTEKESKRVNENECGRGGTPNKTVVVAIEFVFTVK